MLRIACIRPFRALLAVFAWRALSELRIRMRELDATGELDRRVAARRAGRIERALERAGLREPARAAVPVLVATGAAIDPRVHAAVHVGSVRGADLDDVGLLEAAMQRTATKKPLVTYVDDRSDAHSTDWGEMLGEERFVERAWRVVEALGALPLLAMVLGVALTFYPLVRPLDASAPWFALGGLALVTAGVVGSRWASRAHEEDDDDDLDGDDPVR